MRAEIEELYAEYAACLDDLELERWPDFFVDPCLYRVTSRENFDRGLPLALILCESAGMLRDRVVALRKTSVYSPRAMRHIVSGVRVGESDANQTRAGASFVVFESPLDEPTRVFCAGRYLDVLVRTPNGLRFRERTCVLDSPLILGSLVYPV
jgi:3-phenylpropionate/cinnamic acid dioxygenase small subunit